MKKCEHAISFTLFWIPDLFMKMVESDDYWYLMCPNKCEGLSDCYGEEFNEQYMKYVEEGKYEKKMKARELWFQILIVKWKPVLRTCCTKMLPI